MPRNETCRPYEAGAGNPKPPRWAVPDMSDAEYFTWNPQFGIGCAVPVQPRTPLCEVLPCGCEPHSHKCLISEGGCGRCVEHCTCTPSGVASTGAGRAEDTGSPGTPPLRRRR